jgi:hypothetical protein
MDRLFLYSIEQKKKFAAISVETVAVGLLSIDLRHAPLKDPFSSTDVSDVVDRFASVVGVHPNNITF